MREYTVTMEVTVSVTVHADGEKQARLIALGSLEKDQSEFDRRVISVEDITPVERKARKGRGSY